MRRFKTVLLRFTFAEFDLVRAGKEVGETWEGYVLRLVKPKNGGCRVAIN